MTSKFKTLALIILFLVILDAAFIYIYYQYKNLPTPEFPPFDYQDLITKTELGFTRFSNEKEFKNYLAKASENLVSSYGFGGIGMTPTRAISSDIDFSLGEFAMETGLGEKQSAIVNTDAVAPERVSETNVQVKGIDEPDIVKTDGKEIFYSNRSYYYSPSVPRIIEEGTVTDSKPSNGQEKNDGTKIIKAFPATELSKLTSLEEVGNLLLTDNLLVIFSDTNNKIVAYDVTDPQKPTQKWVINFKENNYLQTARLYNGKIYFITRTNINQNSPCPYIPLSLDNQDYSIECTSIYHPTATIPVDVTYSVFTLDPSVGKITNETSFIGSSSESTIYMSADSIYVAYIYPGDFIAYIFNFMASNTDIIPSWLIEKLAKLKTYDLSDQAKLTEFQTVMETFFNSLTNDESLRIENEIENRMQKYYVEHKRELEQTGLVKIDIDDLKVTASGNVPGVPLNQFSLDEYNHNLRIATTVGGRRGFSSLMNFSGESANDVYILDNNLKQIGSIKDLGLTERIYAVRFIEDKGYVVTFRETDPLYVLDLSDPKNPLKKGELKIPGYSSYLHPITKDKLIGIGKESQNVKISLFDVSDPTNPKEIDNYQLNEYWTEISNTHHAFLLDDKFSIFFMPGSKGGYIFSYTDDKLKLVKAVSDIVAQRAIFIDNYLYVIGANKISVLDEANWEKVKDLEL